MKTQKSCSSDWGMCQSEREGDYLGPEDWPTAPIHEKANVEVGGNPSSATHCTILGKILTLWEPVSSSTKWL